MELRHLRYFVAVAEELHVTRAAAQLHIAQQALSAQIRNLEMELGFDLLVRGSRGVTLTAAGRSFLEGAKRTLEAAVTSVEVARSVAEQEANVLRIGFCSYAMRLGLGDAIAAFRGRHPEVQIVLDDLPASEQLLRISKGRLDVAICSIPLFKPEIGTVTLALEKLVGLIPAIGVSPMATPIYLRDYAKLPFIALDREAYGEYWRYLDQLCQEHGINLEPVHEVKEKHSLLALVAGGMGVSILPAHIAETAHDSLRILPIEDLPNEIPIVAAFDAHSSNAIRDYFLNLLKEEVASRRIDLVPEKEMARLSSVG
jgi:DNA-binding transcriptional LysR family regulator